MTSRTSRMDEGVGSLTRYDVAELPTMTVTPEGYLRGEVPVTRTGVFSYMNADGSIRRELRHPDDILRTDSLDTIKGLVGVMDHPPATNDNPRRLVNANNAKTLQVGFSGDAYRVDSGYVVQPLTVTDAAAVTAVKAGKRGISMGYTLDCVEEVGVYNGETYTHRQRNVAYNHWAIVNNPRAGSGARMRLDSSEAVLVQPTEIQEQNTMTPEEQARLAALAAMGTVRIDGIEYRGSLELVNAYTKAQTAVETANAATTVQKTRADAAEGARDGAVTALTKHKEGEQARIDAAVTARVGLLGDASLVLGDQLKPDGTNRAIMEAAVKHTDAKANLDGQSDDYVKARFDMAVTDARSKVQSKNRSGNGGAKPGVTQTTANVDEADVGAARERMIAGLKAASQPKVAA